VLAVVLARQVRRRPHVFVGNIDIIIIIRGESPVISIEQLWKLPLVSLAGSREKNEMTNDKSSSILITFAGSRENRCCVAHYHHVVHNDNDEQ
jgi:hypothetical protein